MSDDSNAAEVIEVAQQAVEPHDLEPGAIAGIIVGDGARHEIIDLEKQLPAPRRKRGIARLLTADSFVATVERHSDDESELYADPAALTVTAIFNGHTRDLAGWGDHRAVLQLQRTTAWQRWMARNGQMGTQVTFAEHIENSLEDIIDPPAATMLEIAQTFHAHTRVQYRSAKRLTDGQTQLVYDEETTAAGGSKGDLTIPAEFYLSLQPFEGAQLYKVLARLRYRVVDGTLKIGYQLDRPEDVERHAFTDLLADVQARTSHTPLWGTPVPAGS